MILHATLTQQRGQLSLRNDQIFLQILQGS